MKRIWYEVIIYCLSVVFLTACSSDELDDAAKSSPYDTTGPGDTLRTNTGLPVISIHTANGMGLRDKEAWVAASICQWTPEEGWSGMDSAYLKGRGNATWKFPKKPFNLKYKKKTSILGMPKGKRWVFLANYHDRTLLRNALTLYIGSLMENLEWTPRFRYAEVLFNGHHVGNYLVCESVRPASGRLNISDTDDYLLHFDSYYDEDNKFRTAINKWPVGIKSPKEEELKAEQLSEIESFINRCERMMEQRQFDSLRTQYIDYGSFIDYYIIQTLTGNKELRKPRSVFAYRRHDGPLKAGPLWDFDFSTYVDAHASFNTDALWYTYLFRDPVFIQQLKDRWNSTHTRLCQDGTDFISRASAQLEMSQSINFNLFPIRNGIVKGYKNGDESLPYTAAIKHMNDVFMQRIEAMDAFITGL